MPYRHFYCTLSKEGSPFWSYAFFIKENLNCSDLSWIAEYSKHFR